MYETYIIGKSFALHPACLGPHLFGSTRADSSHFIGNSYLSVDERYAMRYHHPLCMCGGSVGVDKDCAHQDIVCSEGFRCQ